MLIAALSPPAKVGAVREPRLHALRILSRFTLKHSAPLSTQRAFMEKLKEPKLRNLRPMGRLYCRALSGYPKTRWYRAPLWAKEAKYD